MTCLEGGSPCTLDEWRWGRPRTDLTAEGPIRSDWLWRRGGKATVPISAGPTGPSGKEVGHKNETCRPSANPPTQDRH